MKKTYILVGLSIVILLIAVNNCIYYFLTKQTLENNLKDELSSLASQIMVSVENSRAGAAYLENSISNNVRTAAVAARLALDPDIRNVDSQQLIRLAGLLNIEGITLLTKTRDDIKLTKSSDPKEEGVSTKTWKPWHQAFQQLFAQKNVTIDWGTSLKNFWTGPFEYQSTDPSSKSLKKFGFYYDGTTDYIINPIVADTSYQQFLNSAGVNAIVDSTIRTNNKVLEITAFNPKTFGEKEMITKAQNGGDISHNTPRPVIFGTYNYILGDDVKLVRQTAEEQRAITAVSTVGDREVLKMYLPVTIKPSADITDKQGTPLTEYVLSLTADYRGIRETLRRQFASLFADIAIVTIITLCLIAVIYRLVGRTRDKYVKSAQETYIDEVNQMFTAIRGQRHDLLNHMHAVHAFVKMKKYDELEAYTGELIEDTLQTNDLITIGQPAIAALIQSKLTTAIQRKISFTYDFQNLTNFPLGVRAVDIVKIVGNLIDNAFEAVVKLPADQKYVHLKGLVENNILRIMISNPGEIPDDKAGAIFEAGYSTKTGGHSGLGLAIAKQLVRKYNGEIVLIPEPGMVVFHVSIGLP